MAESVNNVPLAVDYTSRDYAALREDLLARVRNNIPAWTGTDPSDFGVAMVEAFAYMGDVVNYYIDRIANESFLPTATQRTSILNLARLYGYSPIGYQAASCSFTVRNSSASPVTLPAKTSLVTTVLINDASFDLIWTTETSYTIAANTTTTVLAYNYQYINDELLATSNGQPEQLYRVDENQVVDGSIEVRVQDGDEYDLWTEVAHIEDYGPNDTVYTTTSDANNYVYVVFGDGVSGAVPPKDAEINVTYKLGGGTQGNIGDNVVADIYSIPNVTINSNEFLAFQDALTSPTTPILSGIASGGADPESNRSIKENAPKALRAINRAVTLRDYADLALKVTGVGKANAEADIWSSVTVYVGPVVNDDSTNQFPGYTDNPNTGGVPDAAWYGIQDLVEADFTNKTQIGVSVTVSPPTYVPVVVDVFYAREPQYSESALETAINAAIINEFSYINSDFAEVIHPERLEAVLREIPGISNVKVDALYRYGETAGRNILIGAPSEIFVALYDDISVAAYSTNAKLSGLLFENSAGTDIATTYGDVGTLSPAFGDSAGEKLFSGDYFTYSLVIPNGTTSIKATPTIAESSATVKVVVGTSTVITPTAGVYTITTNVGTTKVSFIVTAGNGTTIETYVFDVYRAS